ncbi:Ger(x)C family spore germination C-terminal domain-containing protein [Bacillus sp. JCM 19041]|uniref:Ger(x)C family spore germination C-terminal domain-containing protein n=1 Tax=Bacillus sp. JCM 19041 TaxID=1460637 RepID=UPI000ACFAD94
MLRNNGIAIFKNNHFLTWFSNEKSKGLDYLTGPISESVGSFSCPGGGEIALELAKYDRDIDIKIIDGKPDVTYNFKLVTSISEVDCNSLDLSLPSSYEKVSKNAEEEFESILQDSITATQELKTDVLGVGQQLYRKHPNYWENVRDDWDNLYKDLDIHVNVEIDITDSGNIINSFSTKDG